MKNLERRLGRLETPTLEEYWEARGRAMPYVLRALGADLEPDEEALIRGYTEDDFQRDCELIERWRASLPPDQRRQEQHSTFYPLYQILE